MVSIRTLNNCMLSVSQKEVKSGNCIQIKVEEMFSFVCRMFIFVYNAAFSGGLLWLQICLWIKHGSTIFTPATTTAIWSF
jgi:hypothetical protein